MNLILNTLHEQFRGACARPEQLPDWHGLQALCDNWHERPYRRGGRGSPWRAHSELVGALMTTVAQWLGGDERLFHATGVLHDLDAASHPYPTKWANLAKGDWEACHPVPCVRYLAERQLPRNMLLAILEHAPHLRLSPSGPLTHALIFCDNLASFRSANQPFPCAGEWPGALLRELEADVRRWRQASNSVEIRPVVGAPCGNWARSSMAAMVGLLRESGHGMER